MAKYSKEYHELRASGFSHDEAVEMADQAILDRIEQQLDEDELYLLGESSDEEEIDEDDLDYDDDDLESSDESYDPFEDDLDDDEDDE